MEEDHYENKKNILILALSTLMLICSMNTVVLANEVNNNESIVFDLGKITEDGTYQFGDFIIEVTTQVGVSQQADGTITSFASTPFTRSVYKSVVVQVMVDNFQYYYLGEAILAYDFIAYGTYAKVTSIMARGSNAYIWGTSSTVENQDTFAPRASARFGFTNPFTGNTGFAYVESTCYGDGSWM